MVGTPKHSITYPYPALAIGSEGNELRVREQAGSEGSELGARGVSWGLPEASGRSQGPRDAQGASWGEGSELGAS